MISGINHITIAVSELDRSFCFYVDILGMEPKAKWANGAYLSLNGIWFCLSVDDVCPSQDYSHIALSVTKEAFPQLTEQLQKANTQCWKANRSEGDSFYFLDPDGHKFELHVGTLESRLEAMAKGPYLDQTLY